MKKTVYVSDDGILAFGLLMSERASCANTFGTADMELDKTKIPLGRHMDKDIGLNSYKITDGFWHHIHLCHYSVQTFP